MPFELRINKRTVAIFDSSDEALARARDEVKAQPDCEPEVLDAATGQAIAPGASMRSRDELAKKVGY